MKTHVPPAQQQHIAPGLQMDREREDQRRREDERRREEERRSSSNSETIEAIKSQVTSEEAGTLANVNAERVSQERDQDNERSPAFREIGKDEGASDLVERDMKQTTEEKRLNDDLPFSNDLVSDFLREMDSAGRM